MTATVTAPLGAEARYWQALAEGRLELPQCEGCGRWHWPAVWRCGDCGSWDHAWRETALAGAVFTWTRTWHPFGGTEGFEKPFATVLVALSGAPVRLSGVIEGPQEALKIGAPVLGRVDRTVFAGAAMPALRWRIEP